MKHRTIPTWLLERVAAGEVPPERAEEVRQILDSDPAERARLAELERSNAEILAALPPAQVAAEVARRAATAESGQGWLAGARRPHNGHSPGRGPLRRRTLLFSSSLAACAGAVLIVLAVGREGGWFGQPDAPRYAAGTGGQRVGAGEVTRVKGESDPHLLLFRKRGGKAELLDLRTDLARAGDQIQISYRAVPRSVHGVILSIDAAGAVNLHFPAETGASTRLRQSSAVRLPHSYELDDAPEFERFLFLTSDQPIDVAAVMASAEKLARDPARVARDRLPLAPDLEQRWYTLRKEAAP